MPQLKVRLISATLMSPSSAINRNSAGHCQARVSICSFSSAPLGNMRVGLSTRPPPVMCAAPFSRPAAYSWRMAGT
jgi:hypothetical protein